MHNFAGFEAADHADDIAWAVDVAVVEDSRAGADFEEERVVGTAGKCAADVIDPIGAAVRVSHDPGD